MRTWGQNCVLIVSHTAPSIKWTNNRCPTDGWWLKPRTSIEQESSGISATHVRFKQRTKAKNEILSTNYPRGHSFSTVTLGAFWWAFSFLCVPYCWRWEWGGIFPFSSNPCQSIIILTCNFLKEASSPSSGSSIPCCRFLPSLESSPGWLWGTQPGFGVKCFWVWLLLWLFQVGWHQAS